MTEELFYNLFLLNICLHFHITTFRKKIKTEAIINAQRILLLLNKIFKKETEWAVFTTTRQQEFFYGVTLEM